MDKQTLKALEEALAVSSDNSILRKQVAQAHYSLGNFSEAREHLNILLENSSAFDLKLLLAKCYWKLSEISAGIIICEDLLEKSREAELLSLYLNFLIKDGQAVEAVNLYQEFQVESPGWRDQDIEERLKIKQVAQDADDWEDEEIAFMEKPSMDFSDVGGMEEIKEEIRIKIIHPLQNQEMYKAFGKKTGGGILLFGPPGCGKTFLARATAGEINSNFISVGLEDIMDMWIGNSEKNLRAKFEFARRNTPCVLFFDEVDALGSKRNDLKQSAGRNVINQFLKEMDGIDTDNDGILILGATNSLWHMDSAFLRPGRFDRVIFVSPPDEAAREKIIELQLKEKPVENIDYKKIASKTGSFSGADTQAMIDIAVEDKLRESIKSGKIAPLGTKDLLKAAKKVKPSTKEWFNTARNYAMYSNSSGLYDDILKHLDK